MSWMRLTAEAWPLMSGVIAPRLCQRLPQMLDCGWPGLWTAAPVLPPSRGRHCWGPGIAAGAAVGIVALTPVASSSLFCVAISLSGLALLAATDLEHRMVPDVLVMPLIGLGVVVAALGISPIALSTAVVGAAVGWGYGKAIQVMLSHSRNGDDGAELGEGDVKASAAIGAWFGGVFAYVALTLAVFAVGAGVLCRRHAGVSDRVEEAPLACYLFGATAGAAAICSLLPMGILT